MKTKELEQELGLSKHTIFYYEKEGFIHPDRDDNGYRIYSEQDIQTLQLVKFLRNLNISIDDVKGIIEGTVSFEECLKINQIHLNKQIEGLKEIENRIDKFQEKQLPILPALEKVNDQKKTYLGFQKTTSTVSLGRKLTHSLALREFIYTLPVAIFMCAVVLYWFKVPQSYAVIVSVIIFLLTYIICIGFNFKVTSVNMLDEGRDQSIEFLQNGIKYYQRKGFFQHICYYVAVLLNEEERYVHYCDYKDIEQVEIIVSKRYMNLGSPIAYELYVPDFKFTFKDGHEFYFYWPMILDDDERYIAIILENKIKNIKDPQNVLYAMKNGINLHDYLSN